MQLQERIDEMYRQYNSTTSKKKRKDLYKGIKRAEAQRRKEKLIQEGVISL